MAFWVPRNLSLSQELGSKSVLPLKKLRRGYLVCDFSEVTLRVTGKDRTKKHGSMLTLVSLPENVLSIHSSKTQ